MNKLINADCLTAMNDIEDKSVDMILCDLPFGTTILKWDSVISFDKLWEHYKRIIKDGCCIALFGTEPFSSSLRLSNMDWYKYDWVWEKSRALGFMNCKNKPMNKIENISVFSNGLVKHAGQSNRMNYYPQGLIPYNKKVDGLKDCKADKEGYRFFRPSNRSYVQEWTNYPVNILKFNSEGNTVHPTQKPVDLLEYLIKTYTNEGEIVLDNCMGSGSTCVACLNTNRKFIGIEKDEKYFEIAKNRIDKITMKG